MKEITVGQNDAGQRLDRFIRKSFPALPSSLIQKYIRTKRIKLNTKRAAIDTRLNEGDVLSLYVHDELLEVPTEADAFSHIRNPRINIIYEDENIILLDKPAGQLCHSDDKETVNTLISHLQAYLFLNGKYDPSVENTFAPSLCNRIDRNTGGIVIAAKNSEALRIMNRKIRERELEKYYLCLVHGALAPPTGALEGFILRDEVNKQVKVYKKPIPGAKSAKTLYRTLGVKDGVSLVECRLITGRTHQIRAQFADAGHPLVGDGKYGERNSPSHGLKYQALYSYKLVFKFKTDSGILEYLNGRSFEVESVPFSNNYF